MICVLVKRSEKKWSVAKSRAPTAGPVSLFLSLNCSVRSSVHCPSSPLSEYSVTGAKRCCCSQFRDPLYREVGHTMKVKEGEERVASVSLRRGRGVTGGS